MKHARTLLSLALTSISVVATQGAGLLNGDFESPVVSVGAYYTTAPAGFAWTIVPGTGIDLNGSYWQASSGVQSVDLNGFSPGTIYQDFFLSGSGFWNVKFDMSANPNDAGMKTLRVDFGPASGVLTSLGTYTLDTGTRTLSNMQWLTVTTPQFSADSSTLYRLEFTSLTAGANGPALDNVQVSLIPEPGSLAIVCCGLLIGLLKPKCSGRLRIARA
jgi:hypothetical protein